MRIAHVTATFPPYAGGTGNVCLHNARVLAQRGHDVTVVTAAQQHSDDEMTIKGVTVRRLVPIFRIGNAPLLPGLISELRGFDIVHLHYPFILGAELCRIATALSHTPLVISFHNDLIGDGLRAQIFSHYQQVSAFLSVQRAARLCAVSLDHYESSQLRATLGSRSPIAVELPNGVDTDHFTPAGDTVDLAGRYGIPTGARVVLFVAALDRAHHFKGLDRLLQAMCKLPDDTWILVVGDGDLRSSYEQQAHQLGVAGRVVFVGTVSNEAIPAFYRSADVTVLPSSPPESFGLVLIESLACGTPVVASNIPGVRTVVDHSNDGMLVSLNEQHELTDVLLQMLGQPTNRSIMGARGRAKVLHHYDWNLIGVRLEGLYLEVLHSSALAQHKLLRGKQ